MEHADAAGSHCKHLRRRPVEASASILEGISSRRFVYQKCGRRQEGSGAGTSWLSPNRIHLRDGAPDGVTAKPPTSAPGPTDSAVCPEASLNRSDVRSR